MGDEATIDSSERAQSFTFCIFAYAAAACAAVAVGWGMQGEHPILLAAVADLAATLVIWGFSTMYGNSSFYDPYWSIAPVGLAAYWATGDPSAPAPLSRMLLASLVVSAWALRLTYNWVRRWEGLSHEDWRYVDFREKFGRWFWAIDLGGIHLFPTVQVFLGCLPLYPALAVGARPLNLIDDLALLVGVAAIAIETVADQQLWRFLKQRQPGDILDSGLWAYSRHPNYFGEILFWWSVYLFGLASDPSWWWTGIGALSITLMFHFASVPMLDKRSVERRPGYAEHMRRVSAIVPWRSTTPSPPPL